MYQNVVDEHLNCNNLMLISVIKSILFTDTGIYFKFYSSHEHEIPNLLLAIFQNTKTKFW